MHLLHLRHVWQSAPAPPQTWLELAVRRAHATSVGLRPSTANLQGGRIYVMPAVKDAHTLCVTFQLPPLLKAYRKKADEYLSHLIGHEGRGSLFSLLKARMRWLLGNHVKSESAELSAHFHQP